MKRLLLILILGWLALLLRYWYRNTILRQKIDEQVRMYLEENAQNGADEACQVP